MRVLFMGTPDFAVNSLKALHQSAHEVVAVVTTPDKAQGRGLKVRPSPVKKFASMYGYPVLQPESLKEPGLADELRRFNADCFVVVAFKILPREIFTIPPKGTVNVHASLLPAYRGAAPINWAIINGEKETGITTMLIDAKVDTGDILQQNRVTIGPHMNAGELHDILAQKGAALLIESLDRLEQGEARPLSQDDAQASRAPKITKELMLLDFSANAGDVHNRIRGLSPYPGSFCYLNGQKLKLFGSEVTQIAASIYVPGEVIAVDRDTFDIACSDYALRIDDVQLEGKKRMSVRAFLNGYELKTGTVLKNYVP